MTAPTWLMRLMAPTATLIALTTGAVSVLTIPVSAP